MPTGRAFLDRLRPLGAPGAAARRGVPADRLAEFGAELEPLFAQLAEVEAEAERIRRTAEHDARRTIADATARAEAMIADAAVRAGSARADCSARGRSEAAVEEEQLVSCAVEDTKQLRARAADGISGHVARAVESAKAELLDITGPSDEPARTVSPHGRARPAHEETS